MDNGSERTHLNRERKDHSGTWEGEIHTKREREFRNLVQNIWFPNAVSTWISKFSEKSYSNSISKHNSKSSPSSVKFIVSLEPERRRQLTEATDAFFEMLQLQVPTLQRKDQVRVVNGNQIKPLQLPGKSSSIWKRRWTSWKKPESSSRRPSNLHQRWRSEPGK